MTIRTFIPHAEKVYVLRKDTNTKHRMEKINDEGLFETIVQGITFAFKYKLIVINKDAKIHIIHDPYSITSSTFSEFDLHLFSQGNHYRIFEKLGAHPMSRDGVYGVDFAVWAPNALRVSVVGTFNNWDGRCHQMRLLGGSGIWEIFIPDLGEGELYKYEIRAGNGDIVLKTDPYAFYTEVPPKTASVVYELEGKHRWRDDEWMQRRVNTKIWERPVSIYEVHLGSWMRTSDNNFLSYKNLADKLIPYVKGMGFTHIELMPIAEHPYAPSWGYQISNFYAPTSRYGKPEDIMEFVDICHQNGIGVILDWVPAHFPKDAHALACFEGTCLYEHADTRKGEHRDWGTLIFNYGRHEVDNFLIVNALFWLEKYHFDGLRVDAVASMLYLDYSRKKGEWIPNKYGGNENLEAVEFLKHTNSIVHEKFPGAMMIAEESTAWPAVSKPTENGGLGFGFKWNMGWMHDVLFYMSKDPVHRKNHHNNLTFGLLYAFNENFILSLSHDEVVHAKGSLINKMPGDEWQKFANLRLLYAFMYAYPGKKLLFMGGEFGQWSEWNHATSLDWYLLEKEPHTCLQRYLRDLNRLYRSESTGFEWIDADNANENVIAFMRKGRDPRHCLFFAMNFSSVPCKHYRMGVPYPVFFKELLNSNATRYWGRGKVLQAEGVMAEEIPWHGQEFSLSLYLPPFGAVVLKPLPPETEPIAEHILTHEETNKKRFKKKRHKGKKHSSLHKKRKKGSHIFRVSSRTIFIDEGR
jgi:1,4-alpha-glucan branching enzyme